MTLKDRVIITITSTIIFYAMSMINIERWIPREDTLVDCYAGKRIFVLKKQDCKTEYKLIK